MIKETFGKKIGMTQMFGSEGELLPVTLVEVEPVCVLEKVTYKNKQKAKIGCFKVKDTKVSKVKKPQKGYFEKIGVPVYKFIKEVAIEENADFSFSKKDQAEPKSTESKKEEKKSEGETSKTETKAQEEDKKEAKAEKTEIKESTENKQEKGVSKEPPQQEEKEKTEEEPKETQKEEKTSRYIGIEIFSQGQKITVRSKTKGKGFAGAIKRHKMHRQPSSHGSGMHRRVGSVGASATPSKIVKNKKMPGHLGASYRVTKNLEILKVDKANKVIFIKGNISGSRGAIIRLIKQN
ncbi:MAG: 50S ribosomal protein L3 [Candidatus Omnitrophica bacterium]|nr:50S ribosomal protein L3 [Candidatus Omnitrophota bacterium]